MKRLVSLAPMMAITNRHFRMLVRCLSWHILLYTEMLTTPALIHGDRQGLLTYSFLEHPLALQIGGSNPIDLKLCAGMGQDFGFDEINLNVGCPSDRVQAGHFGACLFKQPELVAECVAAMLQKVSIPVTVKTRIGVDDLNSYEHLHQFVSLVSQAGCRIFIIHARQAWLHGLNPRQNRNLPPLQYQLVYQLKRDFPHLTIVINGGIYHLSELMDHLLYVDGVMIGRSARDNPYWLAEVEKALFSKEMLIPSQKEVVLRYLPYMEQQLAQGVPLHLLTNPLLHFFQGLPGARQWRRYLTEHSRDDTRGISVVEEALQRVA